MSEMIERVAKAKWARRQEVGRKVGIQLDNWEDETEALREEVMAETRAGFEAMREPTDKMAMVYTRSAGSHDVLASHDRRRTRR
jgi:hypothetical protein